MFKELSHPPSKKKKKGRRKERRKDFPSLRSALPTALPFFFFFFFKNSRASSWLAVHPLLYLESAHSRQEGKENQLGWGKRKLSPQHKWGKGCCLPDLEDTYFWSDSRQNRTEWQPHKWAARLRIQGNGQLKRARHLHPPSPSATPTQPYHYPCATNPGSLKSQHAEWQEMTFPWPWEPLVCNADLCSVAGNQLFFIAHNHNILFK